MENRSICYINNKASIQRKENKKNEHSLPLFFDRRSLRIMYIVVLKQGLRRKHSHILSAPTVIYKNFIFVLQQQSKIFDISICLVAKCDDSSYVLCNIDIQKGRF
jgi:hypothetical protein